MSAKEADPYVRTRREFMFRVRAYARRMRPSEFFSHETAAAIWGAPSAAGPSVSPPAVSRTGADAEPVAAGENHRGRPAGDMLQVSVFAPHAVPQSRGVRGHRLSVGSVGIAEFEGLRVTDPASTWALMGDFDLTRLVVVGDYFARQWRSGYHRPFAGRPALAGVEQMNAALQGVRRPTGV